MNCIRWLKRQLRLELGIPFDGPGPRPRLSRMQAAKIREVMAAIPVGQRTEATLRLAREFNVGRTTIQRAVRGLRPCYRGGVFARRFPELLTGAESKPNSASQ
jgi:hypothetical protein